MTQISRKKIISQASGVGSSSDSARITVLENNEYKITYYEIISGTSGSLTVPSQATINAGEFGLSGNAILSKIDGSNKPTFESPKTAGGVIVTASLNNSNGAWVTSGTYTDSNVALIYSLKIKAIYRSNLTYSNIIEEAEIGSAYIKNLTSDAQAQLDAKLSSTKERLLTICGFAITNPADATSYYFGEYTDAVPQTSQGIYKFQFNENLTVTRVVITVKHVTNPTNESVSFYLRASSTTDQTITTSMDMSTVGASTSKVFVYSGLNLSVTSGTDYELKMLAPTWATNPTSTTIRVKIYGY